VIKVLIADDQELIRDSLKIMIQDGEIRVTATVSDGTEALYEISKELPDVVLLDIRMPGMDGITCLRKIKESWPSVPVIMLTTFDDEEYIFDSLRFGANGYLLKDISQKELKDAICTVSRGGNLITPEVMKTVLRLFSDLAKMNMITREAASIPESIQKNELRIIRLIGTGLANKEVARELNFSEGTVRNYISNILQKLDLRDRTQIAIYAVQNGLAGNDNE
jgi:DNA-binding NarL/FixJ family response regulator